MQIRYETEKKEKEIQLLNKDKKLKELELAKNYEEIKRQRIFIYSVVFVLIVILIFSFILFKQKNRIKKAYELLELKNKEILHQKEEIQAQRDAIEEQNHEIEAQRDLATQQRDQISIQKRKITDSIEYASRIQNAVLPPVEYVNKILPEHFILFKPRDIVSGDFYWITQIPNKDNKGTKTVVAAADCTGHGVPGAFMSMLGISFLNEIVNKNELTRANEILNLLRENVKTSLHQTGRFDEPADGMDIALCIIDNETNQLQYAGAHNPLYLIREGELSEIEADKMPIGISVFKEQSFTNNEIQLEKDDVIYIFSDGYADQFGGENNRKFLSRNFKQLLIDNHKQSMENQKEILDNNFVQWQGKNKQIDDVLVIGLKF